MWEGLSRLTMPDTKDGREKNGKNKRRQLEQRLTEQELEAKEEPPEVDGIDSEYLTDPQEMDG